MSEFTLWIITIVSFSLGVFYSGCESAFIAAKRIRVRHLAGRGNRRAQLLLRYLENPEYFLSAVLVGTNLSVTGCTAVFTVIATRHYGDAGSTVATVILVPFILIFSEIIPKALFLNYANRAALASVYPLRILTALFFPMVKTFSMMTDALTRAFPSDEARGSARVTMEELLFHISDSGKAGVISSDISVLARRAVELKTLIARDVMVPLDKMVMIDYAASHDEYAHAFADAGFSRLPVYKGSRDNVVGVLSVHEFMGKRGEGKVADTLMLPYSVGLDTPIVDVLMQMKAKGRHMAIIRDRGNTVGMITMEDVLERLVGTIEDEFN